MDKNKIGETLRLIKKQTGLDLQLCDYFTGIRKCNAVYYFNVILDKRTSESEDYAKLERFSSKYKTIRVEPNGVCRVAIFFT